jgi:HAD superfamily hydrolase (TIGR01509 family)
MRAEPLTFWRRVFPESQERASDVAERFAEKLRVQLYEDVLATVRLLSSEAELGVLSNSPIAGDELTELRIASSFSAVVSVPDPIRKPHPEAFRQLLAAIKAAPGDVVYVGDSPISDIEPARTQGIQPVWLDRFHDPWSPPSDVPRLQTLEDSPNAPRKLSTHGHRISTVPRWIGSACWNILSA